jgi:hypothetical protein
MLIILIFNFFGCNSLSEENKYIDLLVDGYTATQEYLDFLIIFHSTTNTNDKEVIRIHNPIVPWEKKVLLDKNGYISLIVENFGWSSLLVCANDDCDVVKAETNLYKIIKYNK